MSSLHRIVSGVTLRFRLTNHSLGPGPTNSPPSIHFNASNPQPFILQIKISCGVYLLRFWIFQDICYFSLSQTIRGSRLRFWTFRTSYEGLNKDLNIVFMVQTYQRIENSFPSLRHLFQLNHWLSLWKRGCQCPNKSTPQGHPGVQTTMIQVPA